MMWTWTNYNDELYHHGIKGQRWGTRRFQNEDGTLTPAGRERYRTIDPFDSDQYSSEVKRYINHPKVNKAYNKLKSQTAGDQKIVDEYQSGRNEFLETDKKLQKLHAKAQRGGFLGLPSQAKWDAYSSRYRRLSAKYDKNHKDQNALANEALKRMGKPNSEYYDTISSFVIKDLTNRYPDASRSMINKYSDWMLDEILANK